MTRHLDAFRRILAGPEPIDLAAAALWISAEEFPWVKPESHLRRLDELAAEFAPRLRDVTEPVWIVTELSRFLAVEHGFHGRHEGAEKSGYLSQAFDRRVGMPIVLSVVTLAVARRLGIPIAGVGLPGHFICKYVCPPPARDILFDPYHDGRLLTLDDCQELLNQTQAGPPALEPGHLATTSDRDILIRMLNNVRFGNDEHHLWIADYGLALRPGDLPLLAERAELRTKLGDPAGAEQDYVEALRRCGGNPKASAYLESGLRVVRALRIGMN